MSTELIFMSTNRAKLAHMKYLGHKYFIDIHGFRERTYHGSYSEPRITDREALLATSYASALQQWSKAGRSHESIFFLEDTSVRIDALSSIDETPGVDVKYWMRQMSFHKLNKLLDEHGGSRSVSVRSDMVAHIPASIRRERGISERFIWVHGVTEGEIVRHEEQFAANLVYPWLDDKTFNKWFVPQGCTGPISTLPIELADAHDFRAVAFRKLLAELERLNIDLRRPQESPILEQYSLPGLEPNPPVLVICGYSCAGKSTVATWLSKRYSFLHIEASDYMYRAFRERYGLSSNTKIGDFAEAALVEEPSIAARPIAEFIKQSGYFPVVVTGFRSPAEIDDLRNRLRGNSAVYEVFIDADFDTRLSRAIARQRESVDSEKLKRRDAQEERMGLGDIRKFATKEYVSNMARRSDLSRKFSRIYDSKFDLLVRNPILPPLKGIGRLDALILPAMLGEVSKDFGWTTAETARLIGKKFGIPKEKDNISRYFTQEYRPFFDVAVFQNKARYRLSTTGESVARLLEKFPSSFPIAPAAYRNDEDTRETTHGPPNG